MAKYDFKSFNESVAKTEEWLKNEYSNLHTGAASPAILDGITVDSYGTRQPIKNVASISIEDPKTLRVVPWDKMQIPEIEKEIIQADLGLSTAVDDTGIRVIFPQLTQENREKMVKLIKTKLEDARVAVKKEREEVINAMSKSSDMSEDEKFTSKEELQKLVDEANKKLDEVFENKKKIVMGE